MELEKPDLFSLSSDGGLLDLRGGRCGACGDLNFPFGPYGCTACGAEPDRMSEEVMPGRAQLLTFITIHQKLAPGIVPPCVVGEARLANGSIQEVMLHGAEDQYRDEMMLQAIPVETKRGEDVVIACRFAPAKEA
ncbi:hypothetical protein [Pseudooceanicola sp.]|uniref:Zn-ribbon domain-containing OB-fold protein n=1 Tax=Pseudooceanicola sp. TaxID=1914328 RepID=UPI002624F1E1|nr:hypothetical protein [Pseudooceanicola sp.]MDF1855141.1 hypothetical protein [Pseudooceanicola sp.]